MRFFFLALVIVGCQSKPSRLPVSDVPKPARDVDAGVVNVMLTYVGMPITYGTGLFVSAEGHVLTNAHVLGPAINGRVMKQPMVVTIDGKAFQSQEIQVLDCYGKRNHDLCLLKVDTKPKKFFDLSRARNPNEGDRLFQLSIPDGSKETTYLGRAGKYVKLREEDGRFLAPKNGEDQAEFIEHLRIASPAKSGTSGGPLIAADGTLAGVFTLGASPDRDQANDSNLAISASEAVSFVKAAMEARPKPFRDWQAGVAAELRRLFRKRYTSLQRQDLNLARAGFDLDESLGRSRS